MILEFDIGFTGPQLRDAGIALAAESAEAKSPKWNERAYNILLQFLQTHDTFMAEDLRGYAASINFELPPSNRAWGGVIRRAAENKIIVKKGIAPVKNPKAHCANAALWCSAEEKNSNVGALCKYGI